MTEWTTFQRIAQIGAIGSVVAGVLMLNVAGCASSPDQQPDEATAAETDDESQEDAEEELVYGDLSDFTEIWPGQMERMAGPFDDAQMHQRSGDEILEALEGKDEEMNLQIEIGESSISLGELLEYPGATGFYFVGQGEPLRDVEMFFIPIPERGAGLDEILADVEMPSFAIQIGVSRPQFEWEVPEVEPDLDRWPELDEERLGELLDSGEQFIIYQHMTACGSTPRLNRTLASLELPDDLPLYVDHDFEALDAHIDDERLRLPASSFVAFEDGEWIDIYPEMAAPVEETMSYFFHRIGLVDDGPDAPMRSADDFPDDADIPLSLTWDNYWTALDMTGADLRGVRITNGAISGTSFRDADLRGANFEDTIFSHSDFEGADTEGANFEGVTLKEVVCIDGETQSGDAAGCLEE